MKINSPVPHRQIILPAILLLTLLLLLLFSQRQVTRAESSFTSTSSTPDCVDVIRTSIPSMAGYVDISPAPNCDSTKYLPGTSLRLTAFSNNSDLYNFYQWAGNVVEGIASGDPRITSDPLTYVIPSGVPDTMEVIAVFQETYTDISITKTASPEPILEGEVLSYELTVTNHGPLTATGVIVSDTLPADTFYVGVSSSDCFYDNMAHLVTCMIGNLPAGETIVRTIQVVPTQASSSGPIIVYNLDAIDDTYISSTPAERDTNFNSDPHIDVYNLTGNSRYGIVQFDLSAIPTRSVVSNATLDLQLLLNDSGSYQVNFYALETAWDEITVTYDAICPSSICAFDPGALYGVAASPLGSGTLSVNMTTLVQEWVDGTRENYGVLMLITGENDKQVVFDVHENGATSSPQLIIESLALTNTVEVTLTEFDPVLENNRSTTETEIESGGSYILANPVCGEAGDTVMITGYNWTDGRRRLVIDWDATGPDIPIELFNLSGYDVTGGTWSETVTIPITATNGIHTIMANHGGVVLETTLFSIPCSAPNLIVSQPRLVTPLPITTSQPLDFQATIYNIGDLDAGNHTAGLYFDPTPAPDPSTTHIDISSRVAQVAVTDLNAGSSQVINFSVPSGFATIGDHDVYTVVDSDPGPVGVVAEFGETDNVSTILTVTVGSSPPPMTPSILAGQAFIVGTGGMLLPQANVIVYLFDELAGGALVTTTFTNDSGIYVFTDVLPSTYTIQTYINIDGTDYFYSVSGISVPPAATVLEDLFLTTGCPPVVAVTTAITYSSNDVILSWTYDIRNGDGYEIHRSDTPYFTPNGMTLLTTLLADTTGYTDIGVAGIVGTNYIYKVRSLNCSGTQSAISNQVAKFDFAIVPASP